MDRDSWLRGGQYATFGQEKIFYRIDGAGPTTLLFVHGFPTSSHDWASVVSLLSPKYRCVTFDLLGFGASSKPRRDYDYPLQHAVLAAVVKAAAVERAVLIVHDYAVTLGQDFLAGTPLPPFGLDGIVFLNGALDPFQHRARPLQRFLASRIGTVVGPWLLNRRAVLRALREVVVRSEIFDEDAVWASITSGGGLQVMPRLLHYIAERRSRREALVAAIGASSTPRAFVWGVDDPVSGKHVLDAIRPLAPKAEIHELPGVGHYPQVEAAAEVATRIDELVAKWTRNSSASR